MNMLTAAKEVNRRFDIPQFNRADLTFASLLDVLSHREKQILYLGTFLPKSVEYLSGYILFKEKPTQDQQQTILQVISHLEGISQPQLLFSEFDEKEVKKIKKLIKSF